MLISIPIQPLIGVGASALGKSLAIEKCSYQVFTEYLILSIMLPQITADSSDQTFQLNQLLKAMKITYDDFQIFLIEIDPIYLLVETFKHIM